jgi:hypothetical protein
MLRHHVKTLIPYLFIAMATTLALLLLLRVALVDFNKDSIHDIVPIKEH